MYYSLKGKISFIGENFIVIEVGGIGYQVLVSHVEDYVLGEEQFIFTHQVTREDDQYLIGFSSRLEKDAFLSLIGVKGLGPKTAINALKATTPEALNKAIASNNIAYLKRLPGIGAKAAAQIILDLKGQITGEKGDPERYEDVKKALKQLGFKVAAIDRVLADINEENASMEQVLALALKKLRK
ncbi:MAG: Holliday junction branch migration protein RuvA [Erysipelotrichia bacterium]|jgi:Holliday junction DNA helicase RuvA|nr:Holliday junction branch migration protein RuvA [Bacilli bacterium]NLB49869.1 Holliday junction branch migration protein RuvA [Erysipelotrichia bacterium]